MSDLSKRRRKRNGSRPAPPDLPLDAWATAREVALLRRCGTSTVWSHVKQGLLPQPTYLGPRTPRWRVRDVLAGSEPPAAAEPPSPPSRRASR